MDVSGTLDPETGPPPLGPLCLLGEGVSPSRAGHSQVGAKGSMEWVPEAPSWVQGPPYFRDLGGVPRGVSRPALHSDKPPRLAERGRADHTMAPTPEHPFRCPGLRPQGPRGLPDHRHPSDLCGGRWPHCPAPAGRTLRHTEHRRRRAGRLAQALWREFRHRGRSR